MGRFSSQGLSPGASPSQVPRLPTPVAPRATPRSPGHRATLGRRTAREEVEEAQPCQQMAQLLATFTKRFLVDGLGTLGWVEHMAGSLWFTEFD